MEAVKKFEVVFFTLIAGCTPAVQKAMHPYSISSQFDLSRSWRIAVLPIPMGEDSDTGLGARLVEHAEMQLMKVLTFSVVDRSAVDAVLQEQGFSYSGVVDPQTAVRLGKLMGASAVVTVRVGAVKHDPFFSDSPDQRDAQVNVRIISVETGEVLYSAQGEGSSFDGAEAALVNALDVALLPLLEKGGVK
ncbi:MAG: CsgG/HfaB family protein [bacterium]